MNKNYTPLLQAILGLLCATGAVTATAQAAPNERKQMRIGDVQVSDFASFKGKLDGSSITLTGHATSIVVPDKASNSVLKLHADTMVSHRQGNDLFGDVTLTGNVTLLQTQKTAGGGERIMQGEAQGGTYIRKTGRITLTGRPHAALRDTEHPGGTGEVYADTAILTLNRYIDLTGHVRVKLVDPVRLAAPGELLAAHATVDVAAVPYRYRVDGSPSENKLSFTPKSGVGKQSQTSEVVLSGYDSGLVRLGDAAEFEGPHTTLLTRNGANTEVQLLAGNIRTDFLPGTAQPQRTVASQNVRYSVSRPRPAGDQKLSGVCGQVIYDSQAGTAALEGAVQAELSDPAYLNGPALLTADRVLARIEIPENGDFQYKVTGDAKRTRIQMVPKSTAAAASEKMNSVGLVDFTGFTTALFMPGKSVEITGPETLLRSTQKETGLRSRFRSPRISAVIGASGGISRVDADGPVRFHAERPTAPGSKESITGTAAHASLMNEAGSRQVIIKGKFDATLKDPEHLAEPGRITGQEGDLLRMNLSVTPYDFEIESEHQTAVIEFVPKNK